MRPAAALLLLIPACGSERAPPPTYDDALTALVRDLESKAPPLELPPLTGEEASLLAELVEAYASGGGRLARASQEELLSHGDRAAAAIHAFALDRTREARARARAADLLGEISSEPAAEVAVRLAEEADGETLRAVAARALGRTGRRFVVPRLLFRLKYEKSEVAAAYLAEALARLGNLSGLEGLIVVMDRGTLAEAFSVGRDVAGRFGESLSDDAPAERIRAAVCGLHARWLREGAPPGDPPPLDDRLRLGYARWAARLGGTDLRPVDDARFVLARAGREALESLRAALRERDPFARVRAMEVLGWLGPVARPAVDDLMRLRVDPAHRAEPLLALGRTGDPRAAPVLVAALDERDAELRVAAARALAELRDPATAPALRRALEANRPGRPGAFPEIALFAAQALALLGDFSAVPMLASLADSPVDPAALERALDAAFARAREEGLDDAGYAKAATFEEKKAAAIRFAEGYPPR
ncbi:MAG TPA: HEAT repeat domain-containing protein [Planctomycetota bacterium]|nr:HEAT repeat domain-containing protein [Planctomycetota bacterium]